ncbi:MAG: hypothetical protein ACI9X0_001327, partial [Kiritimatiellia bacterium]
SAPQPNAVMLSSSVDSPNKHRLGTDLLNIIPNST